MYSRRCQEFHPPMLNLNRVGNVKIMKKSQSTIAISRNDNYGLQINNLDVLSDSNGCHANEQINYTENC